MNIIDKFLYNVAPHKALKREVARKRLSILNTGYSQYGANRTKKSMLGWNSRGGSVKEDIIDNLKMLRERSRDLYMGVPIATGALKTTRTNVVGSGLKLKSQIDSKFLGLTEEETIELEEKIEREFSLWADSVHCDLERMNNFYELQQLAFLSWLMNGDCFTSLPINERPNMPYDLRIQLIEADRISTPKDKQYKDNIHAGVEFNENGEVVAYHISNEHPLAETCTQQKWVRVEAFGQITGRPNILHLMDAERIGQKRGVPILAPVIESLKQLGRYTDAELMAAVISGMYTVFIETKDGDTGNIPIGEGIREEERIDIQDENSYELGNGAIIALGEGESVKEANPGRPNTAFDGFVTSICRQIGAALELPYELLIKHFTASYSASRAAMLEAWKMFKMRRTWLATDFCQPIYEEWLSEAVAKDRINAPGFFYDPIIKKAYCGAEWNGPTQGQLDPLKEVKAATERVNQGFSTRAKETTELTGGDFFKNLDQRVREEKLMREGGLVINAKSKTDTEESEEPKEE
ncbi:phage portal protein [Clostridium botulinum]|uniref:phage portal protein n=2 Tax=Clostridium botulinum TaxID=1491 RepID=UPI0007731B11|nr:phage portal protein [Clostridium botulinum]AUN08969.1 phage portal protein [Clostridium botulinum]MBN3352633.1 phage portal protein [Clostridium botulinum]MBN3368367.1 phage portal protein [Clostridium botulinum]MBN3375877.1 phage portal protein [Clostridium botulinum]